MTIRTPRLLIVPATAELLTLEMTSIRAFGDALGADIPAGWPPEHLVDALPWFLNQMQSDSGLVGWLNWYGLCLRDDGQRPLLIGSGGFLGRPVVGVVEVGYSLLPEFQGLGYGTELVGGLVTWALSQPSVHRVAAETSSENQASLRLLSKLGFLPVGTGQEAGHIRLERQ